MSALTIPATPASFIATTPAQMQDAQGAMTFVEMLRAVLAEQELTLVSAASNLGISVQYLHDLKTGRRLPSVEIVERICNWMGRGPLGRLEWHLAGAEAHGWKVRAPLPSPVPGARE